MKPSSIFRKLAIYYKIFIIKRKLDNTDCKVVINDPFLKISITKEKNSKIFTSGTLKFLRHLGGNGIIWIYLSENSILTINGDFLIGNGVRIFLSKNSNLTFGGRFLESESGITENTKIMVHKSINIGKDFLCAWDVFISDSDWHSILQDKIILKPYSIPIDIQDHVWVGHGCSILKGTIIGEGSVIGSKSLLTNKSYPKNSLIAGSPAIIVKDGNISWKRETQ